jgi:hypothetical protein
LCGQLVRGLLEEHIFNEDVYGDLKSHSKFKFLHLGFSLWELLARDVEVWDTKAKHREGLLEAFLGPNFVRVLVKNVSNPKAQVHDQAVKVKTALVQLLTTS